MIDVAKVGEVFTAWYAAVGFGRRVLLVDPDAESHIRRVEFRWFPDRMVAVTTFIEERELVLNQGNLAQLGVAKASEAREDYRAKRGPK